ncbi:hypothetical protein PQX77_021765 [Marasmius sp. AFHP31]|nr:hypothetical protein PQX77_021765 [Marasmius sp. AFHP31]
MLTLHFWDEAPNGQWPVVKLVQELYKEIYPAHPDGGYTALDLHRRSQPLRSTLAMLTLHFWDEAPNGQWPVVKLVQELYKV